MTNEDEKNRLTFNCDVIQSAILNDILSTREERKLAMEDDFEQDEDQR